MNVIDSIEKRTSAKVTSPAIGQAVDVQTKIVEGEKERLQVFSGMVIARKGSGNRKTFTVRRLVQGEGVERTFPLYSPRLVSVKVVKSGKVKRAKLYYMRDRTGKATRLKEKFTDRQNSS